MSETSTADPRGFFERNHYLLRRLHSLSGVVPIGLFAIIHLTTNSSIVWAAILAEKGRTVTDRTVATFQEEVYFIHNLPFLIFTEVFMLWLPILFHALLGIYYAKTGKANTDRYSYQGNWRYSLQRVSGYIGFLFILYHIATLRWGWTFLVPGGTRWEYPYAASTLAACLRGGSGEVTMAGILVSVFYFIGVTMLVYHFANGLWTAAITWGLTISQKAQQRWGVVCTALGVTLFAMGASAVLGFATLRPDEALRIENRVMPTDKRVELQREGKLKPNPGEPRSADAVQPH